MRFVEMTESGRTVQVGDRVSFNISDIFLPEPSEVLAEITGAVKIEGLVVDFSDSGSSPRVFAVVQITPSKLVLVPVNALHVLDAE